LRILRLTSVAVALVTAVALGAALSQLPDALRASQQQISTNAGLSLQDRELAPASAYGVHGGLALRAAVDIPRDGVFYVATGGQGGSTAAPPFYAYWLLPRRHTDDIGSAGWIVDFGADPASLGVKVKVVDDLGGGAQVLQVLR
jgi:hypothetical protein